MFYFSFFFHKQSVALSDDTYAYSDTPDTPKNYLKMPLGSECVYYRSEAKMRYGGVEAARLIASNGKTKQKITPRFWRGVKSYY